MKIKTSYFFLLLLLAMACSDDDDGAPQEDTGTVTVFEMGYRYGDVSQNGLFELSMENLQTPEERQMESSSGLVSGRKNADLLYICQG